MSKLKKVLALALVLCFTLALVACGGESESDSNETTKAGVADTSAGETTVETSAGETTTTASGEATKKGDKATKAAKKTAAKTTPKITDDPDPEISKTGDLIARTTNKAGNASAKFIKSLKGYTLNILYPWENIYGAKKCEQSTKAAMQAVENEFGVTIKEEGQFNQYNESLSSMLAAKKCDEQLYYVQNNNFPSWFKNGYLSNLNTAMRESGVDLKDPWYVSAANGFLNINGNQYGWIPSEDEYTTPYCIVYNKGLLEKKHLTDPAKLAEQGKWDWATLQKYAKKFDNDKSVAGFATQDTLHLLAQITNQNGTSLTKVSRGSSPTTNITDNKVKSALTTIADWSVGKKAWLETFSGQAWNYGKNQMAEGKVAMFYASHDAIKNCASAKSGTEFGIAPFPNKKASKTYTNLSQPQFIAFVPVQYQKEASKILFIRNEYYRQNYVYIQRNFQYKWQTYLTNDEAIEDACNIKYAKNGNKIVFNWLSVCESGKTTTNTVLAYVLANKGSPATAISKYKTALATTYSDVWKGYKITGNLS